MRYCAEAEALRRPPNPTLSRHFAEGCAIALLLLSAAYWDSRFAEPKVVAFASAIFAT